nr:sel1 repeat family protein [Acinetobacter sp. Marseille-Q1620]
MSENASETINSEHMNDVTFERIQQGDAETCYVWVVQSEQMGFAQNDQEAQYRVDLLVKSSNQDHAEASILLGKWHLAGHYVMRNVSSAILYFEHAVKLGSVLANFELAKIYLNGLVGHVDEQLGMAYLKPAIEHDFADAILLQVQKLSSQLEEDPIQILVENYSKNQHKESLKFLVESDQFEKGSVTNILLELAGYDYFACALLAFMYLKQGSDQQASHYANLAQEQNDPYGCYICAQLALKNSKSSKQTVQAFLLKAAKNGHIESAYLLAVDYMQQADLCKKTEDRQKYIDQAFSLFVQAAEAGDRDAQYSLAQCYKYGIGTVKHPVQGIFWLEKAAQSNHADAQFELSMLSSVESQQHLRLLNAAAEKGHPQAMLCMAIYEQKHHRIDQAKMWLLKAKEHKVIRAYYLLAQMYRNGVGVKPDLNEYVELLKQAAEFGEVDAYFELFKVYKEGIGVRRNKKCAVKYLNLAKAHQHLEASSIELS